MAARSKLPYKSNRKEVTRSVANATKQPKGGGKRPTTPINVPKGAKTSLMQGYSKRKGGK